VIASGEEVKEPAVAVKLAVPAATPVMAPDPFTMKSAVFELKNVASVPVGSGVLQLYVIEPEL
jgi:hypothetical protein